jgi:hypothetical protein
MIRRDIGLKEPAVDDALVALNMRWRHDAVKACMAGGGKFAVLYSDTKEFIFGDGFYHTFHQPGRQYLTGSCVIPITPGLTMVYTRPQRSMVLPELMTAMLDPDEAECVNRMVQAYSEDCIFYRSMKPPIRDDFACGEHRKFADLQRSWIGHLLEEVRCTPRAQAA